MSFIKRDSMTTTAVPYETPTMEEENNGGAEGEGEQGGAAEGESGTETPEQIEAKRLALEGSGEGVTETDEEKTARLEKEDAAAKDEEKTTAVKLSARQEFLKEYGFESEEDFKAFKEAKEAKPETDEEKAAKLEAYNKNLTAFAIQEGILDTKVISQIEAIRGLDDQQIALRDFAAEYRSDNKDRKDEATGEADPVTDEEIQEEFNKFYHIDSSNNSLKGKGERMMKQVAGDVKKQTEAKLADAKTAYDIELDKRTSIPRYQAFVKEVISTSIPTELNLGGEGDDAIIFKLTDDKGKPLYDMKEVEDLFVDNKLFNRFKEGKDPAKLKEFMAETLVEYIEKKNKPAIRALLIEQGKNSGRKEGSTVGATAPFKAKEAAAVQTSDKELSPEAKLNLNKRFGRPGQSR